jgi:hypothetical protein
MGQRSNASHREVVQAKQATVGMRRFFSLFSLFFSLSFLLFVSDFRFCYSRERERERAYSSEFALTRLNCLELNLALKRLILRRDKSVIKDLLPGRLYIFQNLYFCVFICFLILSVSA